MSDHVDHAARAMDPDAFADRKPQRPSAELQWAVRRKIATDHAQALDAAGLLRRPTDPEVHVEATGTGRTCVVKVSGQTIFDGVGREALIRTKSAAEHDAAVAAKALRDAQTDVRATLNVDQSKPLTIEQAMHAIDFWLGARADRIEREAGESGADA